MESVRSEKWIGRPQPRREPVVNEHAQRLPHTRNAREPVV
jgi:hypothetical protein